MTKISKTKHVTKRGVVKRNPVKYRFPELKKYVKLLKDNGFSVYTSDYSSLRVEPISYVTFTKNGNIGEVSVDYASGFSFSSVHKPNMGRGSGFSIHNDIFKPTIKHAYDTFIDYPNWANYSSRKSVVKYSNFAEYKKKSSAKMIKL